MLESRIWTCNGHLSSVRGNHARVNGVLIFYPKMRNSEKKRRGEKRQASNGLVVRSVQKGEERIGEVVGNLRLPYRW
jgi:hypothetical protein